MRPESKHRFLYFDPTNIRGQLDDVLNEGEVNDEDREVDQSKYDEWMELKAKEKKPEQTLARLQKQMYDGHSSGLDEVDQRIKESLANPLIDEEEIAFIDKFLNSGLQFTGPEFHRKLDVIQEERNDDLMREAEVRAASDSGAQALGLVENPALGELVDIVGSLDKMGVTPAGNSAKGQIAIAEATNRADREKAKEIQTLLVGFGAELTNKQWAELFALDPGKTEYKAKLRALLGAEFCEQNADLIEKKLKPLQREKVNLMKAFEKKVIEILKETEKEYKILEQKLLQLFNIQKATGLPVKVGQQFKFTTRGGDQGTMKITEINFGKYTGRLAEILQKHGFQSLRKMEIMTALSAGGKIDPARMDFNQFVHWANVEATEVSEFIFAPTWAHVEKELELDLYEQNLAVGDKIDFHAGSENKGLQTISDEVQIKRIDEKNQEIEFSKPVQMFIGASDKASETERSRNIKQTLSFGEFARWYRARDAEKKMDLEEAQTVLNKLPKVTKDKYPSYPELNAEPIKLEAGTKIDDSHGGYFTITNIFGGANGKVTLSTGLEMSLSQFVRYAKDHLLQAYKEEEQEVDLDSLLGALAESDEMPWLDPTTAAATAAGAVPATMARPSTASAYSSTYSSGTPAGSGVPSVLHRPAPAPAPPGGGGGAPGGGGGGGAPAPAPGGPAPGGGGPAPAPAPAPPAPGGPAPGGGGPAPAPAPAPPAPGGGGGGPQQGPTNNGDDGSTGATDDEIREAARIEEEEDKARAEEERLKALVDAAKEKEKRPGPGFFKGIWNNMTFLSIKDIMRMGEQVGDFFQRNHERNSKRRVGVAGSGLPGRLGREFSVMEAESEDEAVNKYKGGMEDDGDQQVRDRLYASSNKDEIKACLLMLADRGVLRFDDPRIWRALNRILDQQVGGSDFKIQVNRFIDQPDQAQDQVKRALDFLWGDNTGDEMFKTSISQFESEVGSFEKEAGDYENGYKGTDVSGELHNMLIDHVDGVPVKPQRYYAFIRYIMTAGKGAVEDKFYYIIMGLYMKDPDGNTLLNRRIMSDMNSLSNALPFLDFFTRCTPAINGKDKGPYPDEYLADLIAHFGFFKNKNAPDHQRFNVAAVNRYIWQDGLTHKGTVRRVEKGLRNAEIDHDDAHFIIPLATASTIKGGVFGLSSGTRANLTDGALRNGLAGFNMFFSAVRAIPYDQTVTDARTKNAFQNADEMLLRMIPSYIYYVAGLSGKVKEVAGNFDQKEDFWQYGGALIEGEQVRMDEHHRQMSAVLNDVLADMGFGQEQRQMLLDRRYLKDRAQDDDPNEALVNRVDREVENFSAAFRENVGSNTDALIESFHRAVDRHGLSGVLGLGPQMQVLKDFGNYWNGQNYAGHPPI